MKKETKQRLFEVTARLDKTFKPKLNEEVRNLINEGFVFDNDAFKFKQLIRYPKTIFYNYDSFTSDYDTNISDASIVVNWGVLFWLNQYGIENFSIKIESLDGVFKLQYLDKQTDQVVQEMEKNINDTNWKFVVEDNVPLITKGNLYIKDLTFDFKNNVCTAGFYKSKNI